jgi:ParB/RepB/Spo0J family partition protein
MKKSSAALEVQEQRIIIDELVDEGTYSRTELKRIRISPDNRKRFDQVKLEELAASIKSMGVAQPILIRPVDPTEAEPEEFEIVAGERRFRASTLAGMFDIPTMIRHLSDVQAAKIRILENLQREDPHPMEEAEGYQQLMMKHGYSADQLADEIHKSRSYVFGRLKLCSLTNEVREQFLDDKFPASTALIIARVPVPALQARAAAEILDSHGGQPMSYRAAVAHMRDKYMLDLTTADFDLTDGKLLGKAGSCSKCPKRTGNQPEIFADLSADVCTDPDCFTEKRAAHVHKVIVLANKKGIPTFDTVDALNHHGFDEQLVRADQKLWDMKRIVDHSSQWNEIGTKISAADLPAVKAYLHMNGKLTPVYAKAAMQAALEAINICASEKPEAEEENQQEGSAPNAKRLEKMKAEEDLFRKKEGIAQRETSFRVDLYKQFRARAATGLSLQSLREFVKLILVDDNSYSLPDDLLDLYGLASYSDEQVSAHIDQATLPEVQLILIDLVLGECLGVQSRQVNDDGSIDDDDYCGGMARIAALNAMASHEGIDPLAAREQFDLGLIDIGDLEAEQILPFLRHQPERINELTKFFLDQRPHLLGALEFAGKELGFAFIGNSTWSTQTLPGGALSLTQAATAPAEVAQQAPSNDLVACEGEDLEAAIAEPAPTKKAGKTKSEGKKPTLTPAAAWPWPTSSAEALSPAAPTVSTAATSSTQEAT